MADRRENGEVPPAKRQKLSSTMDPKDNPYLAHMYPNGDSGYGSASRGSTPVGDVKRHKTTAAQAKALEEGPNNPFTNKPLSSKYHSILKTRRNLPVHAQR